MPGRARDVSEPPVGADRGPMTSAAAGQAVAGSAPGPVAGPGAAVATSGGRAAPGRARQTALRRRLAEWAAFCVPGLIVVIIDGFDLGHVPLWRDEAYTLEVAQRPIPAIFTMLHHTDAVNSTYYMLMHGAIGLFGTSTAGLRVPSLLAMAVAAVVTAVIGRRLARAAALPAPALTGVAAGVFFAVAPQVTRYAQEARAYAIVTMLASIATYLLLRGIGDGRWRWWASYGVVITVIGLLSLLGVLLLAAHAVTLVAVRLRAASTRRDVEAPEGRLARWLAASAVAVAPLIPLLVLGYEQKRQVSWLHRPGFSAVTALASAFAGSRVLLVPVALLALAGVAAGFSRYRRGPLDVAVVALPWLIVPAVVLLLVSQVHPLYDGRYVTYSLPALALLVAAGLSWLVRAGRSLLMARADARLAWLVPALTAVILAGLLLGPQRAVRATSSRPDNLRRVSAILAAHARPGDAVFYMPVNRRVDSAAYPGPYQRLRDLALRETAQQAHNLLGRDVTPAVLDRRFVGVQRLWVLSAPGGKIFLDPRTPIEKAEAALVTSMHLAGQWHAGGDMVSLFVRG